MSQASDGDKQESGDADVKDDSRDEKRSRVEETSNSTADDSTPVAAVTSQKALPPARCNQCRQLLDDPDLRLFPGDHSDAVFQPICSSSMYLAGCLPCVTACRPINNQSSAADHRTVLVD